MISQIEISLDVKNSLPFINFLTGKDKELLIDEIVSYNAERITYIATLRKLSFISPADVAALHDRSLSGKYGIEYFEILDSNQKLKTYRVLLIQQLPELAKKLLMDFENKIFLIPPLSLIGKNLVANILVLEGYLEQIKNYLDSRNIDYRILKVSRLNRFEHTISDKEIFLLKFAYIRGFFNQPRETNMESLADELGLSKSTFLRMMRNAEKKVIGNFIDSSSNLQQ